MKKEKKRYVGVKVDDRWPAVRIDLNSTQLNPAQTRLAIGMMRLDRVKRVAMLPLSSVSTLRAPPCKGESAQAAKEIDKFWASHALPESPRYCSRARYGGLASHSLNQFSISRDERAAGICSHNLGA